MSVLPFFLPRGIYWADGELTALTPDRPIPELAAECDESNEQKENESESESQTLFTKPIGSCTNALTPTYKSTFGQKILINGADLQLRRGSQSTLKGLDHLAL